MNNFEPIGEGSSDGAAAAVATATRYVVRHIHDGRIFYFSGPSDRDECSGTADAKTYESASAAQDVADRLMWSVPEYSWHAVSVADADVDDANNDAAWAARETAK